MSVKLPEIKEMFLAKMHYGHIKGRSHPKAKDFVFGLRNGINIIDLSKTQEMLADVLEFIIKEVSQGKTILFVGTKRQIKEKLKLIAEKYSMPYVSFRWLGGTLTNFETIRRGIKSLEESEAKLADSKADMTKKEKTLLEKEIKKLNEIYGGIKNMKSLPDIMFAVDIVNESNAITEAKKKGIVVIGVCDTDANPKLVDWCIPANDDAKDSINLILDLVAEAVEEGKGLKTEKIVKTEETVKKLENEKNSTKKEPRKKISRD